MHFGGEEQRAQVGLVCMTRVCCFRHGRQNKKMRPSVRNLMVLRKTVTATFTAAFADYRRTSSVFALSSSS